MHFNYLRKAGILTILILFLGCVHVTQIEQPTDNAFLRTDLSVFIVRHAEAYKNLSPPVDMSDEKLDSLTPRGIKQAVATGKFLRDKGVVAVIASPSGRARQTAELIAKNIGLTSPPDADVAFSSMKKGKMPDGEPVTWDWREKQWKAGRDPRPQGGEALQDGLDRASLVIEALSKKHPGQAVVIVTHSDICAALIGKAAGTPLTECYQKHKVPLGSMSEISVSTQSWILKSQGMVPKDAKSL